MIIIIEETIFGWFDKGETKNEECHKVAFVVEQDYDCDFELIWVLGANY